MRRLAPPIQRLKPRTKRGRILLWSCLLAIIFSAIQFGEPLNNLLSDIRLMGRTRTASGDIVLVGIDNRSLEQLGSLPWPRRRLAQTVEQLRAKHARRIFLHQPLSEKSEPADDAALEVALKPFGDRAILPVTAWIDPATGKQANTYPLPEFRRSASLAHTNFEYLFGTVRRLPYGMKFGSTYYPSVASKLANSRRNGGDFFVDYSIQPSSIPTLSAADVIAGRFPAAAIAGKDVVIGFTNKPFNDGFVVPRYGPIPGVYRYIIGAETLKEGNPIRLSWLAALLPAILIAMISTWVNRRILSIVLVSSGICAALLIPLVLDRYLIWVDCTGPLFLLVIFGGALSWSASKEMYRTKGMTNVVSGLPNLTALSQQPLDTERALVAARVHNYAAIVSTLSAEGERALVLQMAKRMMVGASEPLLYQGDEGIFAWFAEPAHGTPTGSHLDALHALFRNPVSVEDKQFDLVVTFGFDADNERMIANRLASALVAADEAYREGLKWKEHDKSTLEDSTWRLSLLSQLDAAIDAGDLWVAYQPKLDLTSDEIIGAEALARWTHSEKGPISPLEFILAAEQSNRIEKLTQHVLEQAIRVAAVINGAGVEFNVSVNLSARLIGDSQLPDQIGAILAKHRLPASCLTLEVTETAALGTGEKSLNTLQRLRDMGINLSVDDYGTGMSTLDYLQRIPATEIKIDRSFVIGMRANHATKVMVNSTIQLAHSLGQKVVAEGVEDEETLCELRRMNCDLAQGYLIGRPMTFRALSKKMLGEKREVAA